MENFRNGELKILVATDITARGIDIPSVELVVNYDMPETAENYVHRVGRTGRGAEKGQAISFCSSEEKEVLNEVENNLGKPILRIEISKKDYEFVNDLSEEKSHDWKALLLEEEKRIQKISKKKKKKF